jgi:hypothetical protein
MPLLRAFWDSALAVAPKRAGAIDDGRRVGYESPEELGQLWQSRGLVDVATGELWVQADYASFDRPLRAVYRRHRPLRRPLRIPSTRSLNDAFATTHVAGSAPPGTPSRSRRGRGGH